MKEKIIIIALIQYTLESMKELMLDAGQGKVSAEKIGALKAFGLVQIQLYINIAGDHWQGSPQDLQLWLVGYCKREIAFMEARVN